MIYTHDAGQVPAPLFLEGVTVCVNYADFLDHALKHNLHHFDHFVVVTSHDDKETQKVCEEHSTTCVVSDVMLEGGTFNKGKAINLGMAHFHGGGYFMHMDSDIILPDRFRTMLNKADLNPECIYGADRVNVSSYEAFEELKQTKRFQRQFHHRYLVDTPDLPLGARLLHDEFGYAPIGFFQLWHSSQHKRYPINQGSAEHTDVLFSLQWRRRDRILLPNVICYHLESEPAKMGANWKGRKTKRFEPAK